MNAKRWLLLPFDGASSTGTATGNGEQDPDVQVSRKATAEDFSHKKEEDIVADYNAPIHMWVVATLFPLTAGTFGPMASMFNICAIAIPWRIIVNPDTPQTIGQHIPDPKWLVPVNIVSLVIAILANLSLLGQMTNRLRYNVSGPVTIAGFYISGLVDIALVSAASSHVPLPPNNPNATYSQAFYYAAFSGAIYVILAMLLSWTAYGIWFGHYSNEFKLSLSQRSLMLQTILFLSYILGSGGVYSYIEGWDYLDANYFVVVTLFTIGFGDLSPSTHLGRSLFFPFSVGGILFVGVIIANIRTLVLESGSVKVSTRLVEKARHKSIQSGNPEEGILKLRGIRRRDTNAPTELERREKEFDAMREIQQQAAHNNRLFSLTFAGIAFMILWFIGAVVFWQAETKSVGGEQWSYFDSLYFTFVAQLTIGYGDYSPQTHSGKPAFVLWALIALPTLTVLIGAIGDVVSDLVNWYTVWLGKNTIGVYRVFGLFFSKERKDKKVEKAAQKREDAQAEEDNGFHEIAAVEERSTVPVDFKMDGLSEMQAAVAEEKYKPFMMLKAMQHIVEHIDADPPRKYTFKEWSWLLKLLGEDEADEEGHRRVGMPVPDGAEVNSPLRAHQGQVWSWLGQESPLMSLEEDSEPKWVLKRLMHSLEKELKARAERHIKRDLGQGLTPGGDDGTQYNEKDFAQEQLSSRDGKQKLPNGDKKQQ